MNYLDRDNRYFHLGPTSFAIKELRDVL